MSAKKILIVDDDDFVLDLLDESLKASGYESTKCRNGAEALREAQKTEFNAVITDVNMPEKDGLELVKELKAVNSDLPVLMISGEDYGSSIEKRRYLNSVCHYADDILGKPFSKEELLSTLEQLIEKKF